jgi:hypothetical protein
MRGALVGILETVAQKFGSSPPLRVFFGEAPIRLAKADYESRIKTWEQWQPASELAQG